MANWEKLNAEFDAAVDSMMPEDWQEWEVNRAKKRKARKCKMQAKAKLQYKPALGRP